MFAKIMVLSACCMPPGTLLIEVQPMLDAAHELEVIGPQVCWDDADCPADQFCATYLGLCEGPGECVDRLSDLVQCLAVWDPVCGCDGQTYSNGCYATKAALSIDYVGECSEGCFENGDCPVDQYCDKLAGDCEGPGECVRYPALCQNIWTPVCGFDGVTYSNACYPAKAAVSVDYEGECWY